MVVALILRKHPRQLPPQIHSTSFFLHEHLKAVKDRNKPSLKNSLTGPSLHACAFPHFPSGRRSPSEPCAHRNAPHASARSLSRGAPWLWPTVTQTISSRLTSGHPLPSRAPPTLRGSGPTNFASPCRLQHHPVSIRSTMWGPITVESANEGRVHNQLTTPKQWKAVNDDLQLTLSVKSSATKSMSRTKTFVDTRPPTSRHMHSPALPTLIPSVPTPD